MRKERCEEAAKAVRHPVEGIMPTPSGCKGLVVLVQHTDDGGEEKTEQKKSAIGEVSASIPQAELKEQATEEKIARMQNLVEVRDARWPAASGLGRQPPKQARPDDEQAPPERRVFQNATEPHWPSPSSPAPSARSATA